MWAQLEQSHLVLDHLAPGQIAQLASSHLYRYYRMMTGCNYLVMLILNY